MCYNVTTPKEKGNKMTKYGVYVSDCEELWEETFDSIEEAAEAIKRWAMEDELIELERFQIVELKPAAEFKIKVELKLKCLD